MATEPIKVWLTNSSASDTLNPKNNLFSEKSKLKFSFRQNAFDTRTSVFHTKKNSNGYNNRELIKLLAYVLPMFPQPIISNYMAFKIKNAV